MNNHKTTECLTQLETVLFLSFGTFGRLEHLAGVKLVGVFEYHLVDDSEEIVNLRSHYLKPIQ